MQLIQLRQVNQYIIYYQSNNPQMSNIMLKTKISIIKCYITNNGINQANSHL